MLSFHMEALLGDQRRRRRPGDEHNRQPKAAFTFVREVVTTFRTQAVGEEHGNAPLHRHHRRFVQRRIHFYLSLHCSSFLLYNWHCQLCIGIIKFHLNVYSDITSNFVRSTGRC